MFNDLPKQIMLGEDNYESPETSLSLKPSRKFNKLLKIKRAIQVGFKPQFSLRSNLHFLSENSFMVISKPQIDHDKILGQISASYFSYSHRIRNVAFDINSKYLLIQTEIINTDIVPLDYVIKNYSRFLVQNAFEAIQLIERGKRNDYGRTANENPFIIEDNWMDYLLTNEPLPAFLQRVSCLSEQPQFEYVYNENYMKLAGILPNILMDAILQSQQIPELAIDTDLELWTRVTGAFLDSNQKHTINEHRTLVMTFEGVKIEVIIKEIYVHTYIEKLNGHYYARKVTYQIVNPFAFQYVFDQNRINKNSVEYILQNNTQKTNDNLNKQLLFETDPDMLAKYTLMKPCGYKSIN